VFRRAIWVGKAEIGKAEMKREFRRPEGGFSLRVEEMERRL
jgi:hypothetical protein